MLPPLTRILALVALVATAPVLGSAPTHAADAKPGTVTLDWATYNPVSVVLKNAGKLERDLAAQGIAVRWVQSLGSNKAIEFLNAKSLDFGSTAGVAALIAKINGAPIRAVYVYSKPEWTALVTRKDTGIATVADLKGRRVAVTRGTDPYVFLLRSLAKAGLGEKDIKPVLLQHQDGRVALIKGDVDAWAGLDPLMAQAELDDGAVLFHRSADQNTYGVLNVREAFAAEYPAVVRQVLAAYDAARRSAIANPDALKQQLAVAAKLSIPVAARQLERTDLTTGVPGKAERDTILAAGLALQQAGVIDAAAKVEAAVDALLDPSVATRSAQN